MNEGNAYDKRNTSMVNYDKDIPAVVSNFTTDKATNLSSVHISSKNFF